MPLIHSPFLDSTPLSIIVIIRIVSIVAMAMCIQHRSWYSRDRLLQLHPTKGVQQPPISYGQLDTFSSTWTQTNTSTIIIQLGRNCPREEQRRLKKLLYIYCLSTATGSLSRRGPSRQHELNRRLSNARSESSKQYMTMKHPDAPAPQARRPIPDPDRARRQAAQHSFSLQTANPREVTQVRQLHLSPFVWP